MYCLVPFIELNDTQKQLIRFETAVCMPKSCSNEMIQEVADALVKKTYTSLDASLGKLTCMDGVKEELNLTDYMRPFINSAILTLVLLSTLYHVDMVLKTRPVREILSSFSVLRNFPKLVNSFRKGADQLACLDGIRAITMFWIVIFNFFYFLIDSTRSLHNGNEYEVTKTTVWHSIIYQAHLGANTFFLINTFLMSYSFISARQNG